MTVTRQKRGIIEMSICATLWSLGGIFIKIIPWNPLVIAGARSILASCVIAIYMKAAHMHFRINKEVLLGGIFLTGDLLLIVSANKFTTAANATMLQFTSPIFILLISIFFLHETFRRSDIIAVAACVFGIALFFFDQLSFGNIFGNIMATLSGLSLSVMYIVTGNANEDNRMSSILIGHLLTAAIGLPFAFVFDTPISGISMVSILILGILQIGIPYVLYGLAAKDCSPLMCSLIAALEPILNPVWVFFFNGEQPGLFALIGGVVVIATISIWCVWKERHPVPTAKEPGVQQEYNG
ncbi:MAG: DMT family transporter [Lachnospiraceae bacterium]|nr:DMT family transporter [Lachnospiraceae bacterium]MDY5647982.1 DMT family transporter [Lachnospiraceae bacterium]